MTAQVGRIYTTRMAGTARPLRLAYGGAVLKVRGTQLRPEREMLQTGFELIGSDTVAAVAEVLRVAIDSLEAAGVRTLRVDLTVPTLGEAPGAGPMPPAAEKLPAPYAFLERTDSQGQQPRGAAAHATT